MKKLLLLFVSFVIVSSLFATPRITFTNLIMKVEMNPSLMNSACIEAGKQNIPVSVYIPNKVYIEALDVEDGRVVYSVITNFARPEIGGYTAFYEDITSAYNLSIARVRFADGKVIDNSGEVLQLHKSTNGKLLIIPDRSNKMVLGFDYVTGNLVDPNFIPVSATYLSYPKHAIQRSKTRILVSDMTNDVVQEFDTSGAYIRVFAPAGGVNTAILDNIRGMCYRPNGNLLVCNAGSGSKIQQFDTGGVFINSFITTSVNYPTSILYRPADILVANTSGGSPLIFKYNLNGTFIGPFTTEALTSPGQSFRNTDGTIMVCESNGTSQGLKKFDSTGTLITTFTGATGLRGVFRLGSGNYVVTNSAGLHEIDDTTGALIRTIYSGGVSLEYIDVFDSTPVTGVENNSTPVMFKLYDNYPNPFNPATTIKYDLAERTYVTLQIFDYIGRLVETLQNGYQTAGVHEKTFEGKNLPSGIYLYKLTAGNNAETRKMVLLK